MALTYRKRTGIGTYIDLSSSEAINVLIGDALMDYTVNGRIQTRKGNINEKMVPHNCYRCKGDDKWISIAIESEKEWKSLSGAIGDTLLNKDERFISQSGRQINREALDNTIEQWTSNFTHYELMELLQQVGVAAMPCFNAEELYNDRHLKERGCWTKVKHPVTGDKMAISPPWKLSNSPAYINSHAPMFGQHSEHILTELLGISRKRIKSLIEDEIIY